MFYVARRWVLTNLYFHVCHWIASHFSPLYSWKLSGVPSKLHNGKIWLIDPPQPQSLPYQTEQLQMHFITQTWAFLFTNLSTLIDICLHCLAWSYCASFTAQAPPQWNIYFSLSALCSPPPLDESVQRAALAALLTTPMTSWSPSPLWSDNDSFTLFLSFCGFVHLKVIFKVKKKSYR